MVYSNLFFSENKCLINFDEKVEIKINKYLQSLEDKVYQIYNKIN